MEWKAKGVVLERERDDEDTCEVRIATGYGLEPKNRRYIGRFQ